MINPIRRSGRSQKLREASDKVVEIVFVKIFSFARLYHMASRRAVKNPTYLPGRFKPIKKVQTAPKAAHDSQRVDLDPQKVDLDSQKIDLESSQTDLY